MLNIKAKDCQYTIYPERKMVVCTIPNTTYCFLDDINDEGVRLFMQMRPRRERRLKMPDYFIGVAVCSPDDEFNVEIGKQVAYSHARDKFNRSYYKRAQALINILDETANHLEELYNSVGDKLARGAIYRHKHIEDFFAEKS